MAKYRNYVIAQSLEEAHALNQKKSSWRYELFVGHCKNCRTHFLLFQSTFYLFTALTTSLSVGQRFGSALQ